MEGYVAAPTPREYRTIDITVDVNSAEQVTQFTYLGAKTTLDGKLDYEIGLRTKQLELLRRVTLIFFVKLDFEIAVDKKTKARDRNFEGVPDSW